jgi:hypothetical protein
MPLPLYQYVVTDTDIGQQISLGNTIGIPLDGSGPFSITGWFRVHALANQATLLGKGTEFSLSVSGDTLVAELAGLSIPASVNFTVGAWHFFAVTADLSSGNGQMTLYLDGAQVGQIALNWAGSPPTGANYLLGGGVNVDFLSATFYNVALPPDECIADWSPGSVPPPPPSPPGPPPPPLPPMVPVANFDFASVPPADVAGSNVVTLLDGAHQTAIAQALSLYGSWVIPAAADGLNPGNGGAFSVQAWILPFGPTPEVGSPTLTILSNGQKGAPSALALTLTYSPDNENFTLDISWAAAAPFSLTSTPTLAPGQWTNVAATYDGTTMTLYVNGTNVGSGTPGAAAAAGASAVVIGATTDPAAPGQMADFFKGGIQALGVWTRALAASEVANYMAAEPTGQAGCAAYFDFATIDLSSQISGFPVQLYETADVLETEAPATASSIRTLASHVEPAASNPHRQMRSLARELGVGGETLAEGALLDRPAVDALHEAYVARLKGLPANMAHSLQDAYRRNLLTGLELRARSGGPLPGTFSHSREGDEWVIWHHNGEGAEEALRIAVATSTPCTAWLITVCATALGVLLGALGVAYSGVKIAQGIGLRWAIGMEPALELILRQPLAAETFIKVVRTLWLGTNMVSVVTSGLSGISWWSWAYTVASILVQITSLWLTGGWWLLFILAQLALSIAMLVEVVNQRPSGC